MDDCLFLYEMGQRISKRRKELHLTQEQIAEKMNVSLQTVSCFELGKKAIRPTNLARLCTILGTTADYILLGNKNVNQLSGIYEKFSKLSDDDLEIVEKLIEHLLSKA